MMVLKNMIFYKKKRFLGFASLTMQAESSTKISTWQFLWMINECIELKQDIFVKYTLTQVLSMTRYVYLGCYDNVKKPYFSKLTKNIDVSPRIAQKHNLSSFFKPILSERARFLVL